MDRIKETKKCTKCKTKCDICNKKYHGFFVNGESLNDKLIKYDGKNIKIFVQKGSK